MARLSRRAAALLLALGACIAGQLGSSTVAKAHPLAPSLLEIVESAPGIASVRWKTPVRKAPDARSRPLLPPQCRPTTGIEEDIVGTAVVQTWNLDCGGTLVGQVVGVDDIASSRANVILRVALADGRVLNTVLTADKTSVEVPARTHPGDVFVSYLSLGVEHLLSGADHLLFLVGIMLLVTSRRQLALTVTAFTVGHSITLSLAVLGIVAFPPGPIEILIALSILVVALQLADDKKKALATPLWRRTAAIAFAFGLLHGFGFAGALSDVGLPQREIPLALLGFNLGIEIAQIAFCGVALAAYALVRAVTADFSIIGKKISAYCIGTAAAFLIIERAAASFAG